ncbi:MAG: amidohydrolase [Pseudomonadota bacterium]
MKKTEDELASHAGMRRIRRALHSRPEHSGAEAQTAATVVSWLRHTAARDLVTGLGGHGLVARLPGRGGAPAIGVRAELDALPIREPNDLLPHTSQTPGCSHKCGHDGHMTMLLGLAHRLSVTPPAGDVYLLFQPAEETGQGAAALLAEPRVRDLPLQGVLAVHNLPGFPRNSVVIRDGPFAAASVGLAVELVGRTAHAGEPERGRSPATALATLINWIEALPQHATPFGAAVKATVIHARLGEVAFGTSPGQATVMATLRAGTEVALCSLQAHCRRELPGIAAGFGMAHRIAWHEPFPATINAPEVVEAVSDAARSLGLPMVEPARPMPWSEDFGHFTRHVPAALVGLGAGRRWAPLHSVEYDFPDALLPVGISLLAGTVDRLQGPESPLDPKESPADA